MVVRWLATFAADRPAISCRASGPGPWAPERLALAAGCGPPGRRAAGNAVPRARSHAPPTIRQPHPHRDLAYRPPTASLGLGGVGQVEQTVRRRGGRGEWCDAETGRPNLRNELLGCERTWAS